MKNNRKQNIFWGSLLILFGVLGLVAVYASITIWTWVAVLAVSGLAAFGLFLANQSDWGLLIPAYVLWAIAGFLALIGSNLLSGALVPTFVLAVIALPFFVGYLRNRQQWGLLIPAYALTAVGLMILLLERGILHDFMVPAYIMFAIALPFFTVFAINAKQWWALIPAGILTIIGLAFLMAEAAVGYVLPVVLIVAGLWILLRQFIQRESAADKSQYSKGDL
ncbi:hypothetical protein [Candidatus Leptofilum sp.]|uniref:hypothetical protein n=1 Tax=Candidatus Leptofilum sp. TaxID=3241576 RepID=UPI003B599DFB